LVASSDLSATVEKTGHVFGLFGQSDKTMPGELAPYYWGSTDSTVASCIIGIYPSNSDDTGLTAADKKITVTSKAMAWESSLYINQVPSAPNTPSGIAAW